MGLSKYLRGIPAESQRQALTAAANYIYGQIHSYLQDIHTAPPSLKAEAIDAIAELRADAEEILGLGVVSGHAHNRLVMLSKLDVARQITLNKLAEREKAKLKALNITPPTN